MENEAGTTASFPLVGSHPSTREQGIELAIFLFLIVPSMALSFLAVKQGTLGFGVTAVATILRDFSLVALILFFLWRNGESVISLGWKPKWRDIGLGAVLFVPFFFFSNWLSAVLEAMGLSGPPTQPVFVEAQGSGQFLLALALVVVVALTEETIFRGYLILRMEGVWGSPVLAVIGSAFVFSLGHGYEGSAEVVTVGVMGVIFAIVYIWRRSLIAPITMHFLQDFLAIVLLPYLEST